MSNIYKSQEVLLASMHNKEIAIAPSFENHLGCKIVVAKSFNTDQFGTFSGEIARVNSAYETLKQKAIAASNLFNYDYVISSEGSFGPHPQIFFTSCDTEMLLFYDKTRELFIIDYEISTDTNHAEYNLTKENYQTKDYYNWLSNVKFPSHAIVIKADHKTLYKGILSDNDLANFIELSFQQNSKIQNASNAIIMNELRFTLDKNTQILNIVITVILNHRITLPRS